jgi:dihydrofolate reductase
VVSRQKDYHAPGCQLVHNISDAIEIARKAGEPELFIIGGAEIYKQSLSHSNRLYLTEIHASIEGDTFFPEVSKSEWKEVSRTPHSADDRHAYAFDFVIYERR